MIPASRITFAVCAAALFIGAFACSNSSDGPISPTPTSTTTTTVPAPAPPSAPQTARYRADFVSTWSATTHPQDPPGTPHFSPLIGGTHDRSVSFWSGGALASEGIRRMAELGRISPFDQEISAAIARGGAQTLITGPAIPLSPGTATVEFEASQAFPLVTLVSMVAPSPDWFAGVASLPLFENGQWAVTRRIDLLPWDAGTDSGVTFGSPDLETTPHQPIARILGFPFLVNGSVPPLGTLTFTRIE